MGARLFFDLYRTHSPPSGKEYDTMRSIPLVALMILALPSSSAAQGQIQVQSVSLSNPSYYCSAKRHVGFACDTLLTHVVIDLRISDAQTAVACPCTRPDSEPRSARSNPARRPASTARAPRPKPAPTARVERVFDDTALQAQINSLTSQLHTLQEADSAARATHHDSVAGYQGFKAPTRRPDLAPAPAVRATPQQAVIPPPRRDTLVVRGNIALTGTANKPPPTQTTVADESHHSMLVPVIVTVGVVAAAIGAKICYDNGCFRRGPKLIIVQIPG